VNYKSLGRAVIDSAIRHHLDTFGCALGGYPSEPSKIGQRIAATGTSSVCAASVIGMKEKTTPEYATFANACMARYLDFNDVYISQGGTHPSDMIPAFIALGESTRATGKDIILAMYAAYEVVTVMGDAIPIRSRGWDQGALITISTAAGAAVLLKLTPEQTAHAISLAMTPSIPLRITRAGELSHWKGCAAAHAAMNALFAARLAKEGLTGPYRPFEGVDGLWKQVTGPFKLNGASDGLGVLRRGLSGIERTAYKAFPAELDSQGPLRMFRQLRSKFTVDQIKSINVAMRWAGWHEAGGGQGDHDEKWDPKTRETADHSLPYLIAVMLVDGKIDSDSFTSKRIADPALRPIMQKISIVEDKELTAMNIDELVSKIDIVLQNGEKINEVARYPGAYPVNPLTDAELETKFRSLSNKVVPSKRTDELLDLCWQFESLNDINVLTDAFRSIPPL
jgi:2-methylcitrate dehydratase